GGGRLRWIGPGRHEAELCHPHRRTPTDYDSEHILLRTIRCVNGEVQTVVECEPVFDYGRRFARWSYTDHVYHQGVATAEDCDVALTLTPDLRLGFQRGRAPPP